MRDLHPLPPTLCPGGAPKTRPPVVWTLRAAKAQRPPPGRDLRELGGKLQRHIKTEGSLVRALRFLSLSYAKAAVMMAME